MLGCCNLWGGRNCIPRDLRHLSAWYQSLSCEDCLKQILIICIAVRAGGHGGFWWLFVLHVEQARKRQPCQQGAHRFIWQDKAPRGKGSRERWSDSTQIIPRARSETEGKLAFPDSWSGDGWMGLMAASRKEWIREDVLPCPPRPEGPTWPLTEVHLSATCPENSFGKG